MCKRQRKVPALSAGEQKSGTTWLWEMLNGHPCLLTAAQPYQRMGAITTKETYYFTSTKLVPDARQFLVPWLGYTDGAFATSDAAWQGIDGSFLEKALKVADKGTATSTQDYYRYRNYSNPGKKLAMSRQCERYFLLEGVHACACLCTSTVCKVTHLSVQNYAPCLPLVVYLCVIMCMQ